MTRRHPGLVPCCDTDGTPFPATLIDDFRAAVFAHNQGRFWRMRWLIHTRVNRHPRHVRARFYARLRAVRAARSNHPSAGGYPS